MLAVFEKTVAKCPEELQSPHSAEPVCALKDGFLASHFDSVHPNSVTVNLGSSGIFVYSLAKQNPLLPRLFAVVDDIFCLFQGHIENLAFLKQQYGLGKATNEAIIVIEAYRSLRDRGPYPADKVVRDFQGKFAFILFDGSNKTVFVAADEEGSVPFFWGSDGEGHLVLSDDSEIAKKGCVKSHAPFPKGCYFTSSGGLTSYEHPRNELKAVPRVDSSGELCGATFKVDAEAKKDRTGMPRVGSSQNWSGHL
ncbi:PREDICTED: stem-specific protein TSJT1-like [Tarenaya hassleriana]|uniref:stem-specific protein TSJT1-like n=1 Tax=Tarenaya hassleriana TaxID=28532 RepID=UPI00053CA42E|nr:PREDICTED: stem-specific protein TSJT1-like [Tarenaya hassleriana]